MFNPEKPPEITASRWLNADTKRTLKGERGKVVVVAIVQSTCAGSLAHALPQAMRMRHVFDEREVTVVALHVAFERLDDQTPDKIQAFLDAHGFSLPVGLDKASGGPLPETMTAYQLQGTPALLLFDRQGRLRRHYLGGVDDLRIGAEIMALVIEDRRAPREDSLAIEKKISAAIREPDAQAGHDHHHGDGCGCHDHGSSASPGSGEPASPRHGEPGHVHGPGCRG